MTRRDVVAAALHLLPGILFLEAARQQFLFRRRRRPRSRAFRLAPIVCAVFAAHFLLLAARDLVPVRAHNPMAMIRTPWHVLFEGPLVLALALTRHLLSLLPLPERRPTLGWLTVNYGIAIGTAVVSAAIRLRPGVTPEQQE